MLELRIFPDPVLNQPSDPVQDIEKYHDLISSMEKTLYLEDGIGLAAPQVGVPVQIFLLCLDLENRVHETYINPEIIEMKQVEPVREGCLSFPEIFVEIPRAREVNFKATTPGGKLIERSLTGLQAQCVQHEYDHLQGKTLLDHCDFSQKMVINQQLKSIKESSKHE